MPISKWNDIKNRFGHGLILGNGASMAVHPGFGYRSLYDAAREKGHLEIEVAQIFDAFGVTDFELVLRRLWHATVVNKALGIRNGRIEVSYEQVKTSLIATVRDIHIPHAEALPHLKPIYEFMQGFKTVVSLNYDLLVYWAAMYSRDKIGPWFKDCFVGGEFAEDWGKMRDPYANARGTTLCFYPHGNLALARGPDDEEFKISSAKGDLLNKVLDVWEEGRGVPLFVCEGTSDYKVKAIMSSHYLQRVAREVLPATGDSLVIYGWGMGDQEEHILGRIAQAHCQRAAVSVYDGDEGFMRRAEDKLRKAGIGEILFFDSQSPNCWNNGPEKN